MKKFTRGFTLIELLVVIAIIGILSSVVLASLNSARTKSRDARRISDIKQIQLANELYFDSVGSYASTTAALVPEYLAAIPIDPTDASPYPYAAYTAAHSAANPPVAGDACTAGETCVWYQVAAELEGAGHAVLDGDLDAAGDVIDGSDDTQDCSGGDTSRYCYDLSN